MESRVRLAGVVVVLALAMTGCGDDGSSDDEVRAGAPGVRNTPSTSLTPITRTPTSDPPTPDGAETMSPPTTYDEAVAHVESATATVRGKAFQSPSGNLHCLFMTDDPGGVSCEVVEGRATPAAGDECPSDIGVRTIGRVEMMGVTVQALCNTDTIINPANLVLDYGKSAAVGRFSCIIEKVGVTCVEVESTRAFFMARGDYRLFR